MARLEIETPEVLVTEAWAKAVEKGRWPARCGRTRAIASTSSTAASVPNRRVSASGSDVEVEREKAQVLVQHGLATAAAAPPGVCGGALVRHRREPTLDNAAALAPPDQLHAAGVERVVTR